MSIIDNFRVHVTLSLHRNYMQAQTVEIRFGFALLMLNFVSDALLY